jgi:hypothetical protein
MNLFEFLKVNDFNVSKPFLPYSFFIGFRSQPDSQVCDLVTVRTEVPKGVLDHPL